MIQGLSDLLAVKGDAYEINLEVFYMVRDSITGWPGGKDQPLPNPPERMVPLSRKDALIFLPILMMISFPWVELLCVCTTRDMKCMSLTRLPVISP